MTFSEIYHDSEENPLKNKVSNESHSVTFTNPKVDPIIKEDETKSDSLVNKKHCERYMTTNAEGEENNLRKTKPLRHQKRKKITKIINIKKSVKATGAHKRIRYRTRHKSGANNKALTIRSKTDEFEPRFSLQYEHEPQKCHWSTIAVKSIDFESFSPAYETTSRKYSKGNLS